MVVALAGLMITARRTDGPLWLAPGIYWDVAIYHRAMEAVKAGLDPYATGLARQIAVEAAGKHTFTYVYPPITIPVLRALNWLPLWVASALYWSIYGLGYVGLLWAVTRCFTPEDKGVMKYFVPVVIYFPALMPDEVILSGNVAYIFYGALFTAMIRGWKRGDWRWFYAAVLIASCVKVPFLTMLAIPALLGERQWLKGTMVGAAGLGLFGLQSWLWPVQFHEYLTSVGLQFQFNADFGQSIASNLARLMYWGHMPYTTVPTLVYLAYGGALFAAMFHFGKLYHQGRISAETYIPVLLLAVIVMNPRIMQYDVHAVALPMVLVLVRSVASRSKVGIVVSCSVLFFTLIDLLGVNFYRWDDYRNMGVFVAVMVVGLQSLRAEARRSAADGSFIISEVVALPQPALAGVDAVHSDSRN